MNLTVKGVAKILRADTSGPPFALFPPVSIDTRTIKPGEIFWALKGPNFDGHDYVKAALDKQAAGAVVKSSWRGVNPQDYPDKIFLTVSDTQEALTKLAGWWRCLMEIPVIAITGSIGKTTTKEWASVLLGKKYRVFKTPGNRNNVIGLPLALLNLAIYHQIAIVEMGANHENEISELCRIAAPTHGLITKIAPVHLEGFRDIDGVIRAKKELYDYVREYGKILAPAHDPVIMRMVEGQKVIGFGIGAPPPGIEFEQYIQVNLVGHSPKGQPILGMEDKQATLNVVGDLWIPAAVAAVAIARTFDVSTRDIIAGLSEMEAGWGRLKSFDIKGMEIWDDTYNSNPESLKAAIELLVSRPARRRILVMGDMLELGADEEKLHRDIGAFLNDHPVDLIMTYGRRAYWIADCISSDRKKVVESFTEQDALAARLKDILKSGDAALFKASRGMFLEQVLIRLFPEIEEYYKEIEH
jgi:UDP-N-acetylmuramoyl-tripeptide--D-alanyl-D-alanine ligase